MDIQDVVWTIALVGMGLVALGFIHVIIQAGKPADEAATRKSAHSAHVLQAWLFVVLLVGFVVGSWATLHNFPIPPQHGTLDAKQVVNVVGRQWSWQITPAIVRTGSEVEFRVTSDDVNHGFAIYAPDNRIVTQTQAMPGYINKLLYTFEQPGTYTVQCLEYCGLGHGPMRTTINVVAANGIAAGGAGEATPPPAVATQPAKLDGEQLFVANCSACHQASGQGLPGAFPPLAGNAVVNDPDPTKHVHVVLFGLQGELVGGVKYAAAMTPFKDVLSNDEIAAIINHERSSWGNHGKPVTPEQVAAVRSAGE